MTHFEDELNSCRCSQDLVEYCNKHTMNSLPEEERKKIERHFAICAECEEIRKHLEKSFSLDEDVQTGKLVLPALSSEEQAEENKKIKILAKYIVDIAVEKGLFGDTDLMTKDIGNSFTEQVDLGRSHYSNEPLSRQTHLLSVQKTGYGKDEVPLYKQGGHITGSDHQKDFSARAFRVLLSWVYSSYKAVIAFASLFVIVGIGSWVPELIGFLNSKQHNTSPVATPILRSGKDTKVIGRDLEPPLKVTPDPQSEVDVWYGNAPKITKQRVTKAGKDRKEVLHAEGVPRANNSEFLFSAATAAKKTEVYLTNRTNFKITEQSLQKLELEGLPNDTLEKLRSLTDQEIKGKKAFLNKLKTTIGEEQAVKFEPLILKRSTSDNLNDKAIKFLEGFEYGLGKLNIHIAEDQNRKALPFRVGTAAGTGIFLSVGELSPKEVEVTDKTAYEEGEKYAEVIADSIHSDNQQEYLREYLDNPHVDSKMKKARPESSGNYSTQETVHIRRSRYRSFKLERADREEG